MAVWQFYPQKVIWVQILLFDHELLMVVWKSCLQNVSSNSYSGYQLLITYFSVSVGGNISAPSNIVSPPSVIPVMDMLTPMEASNVPVAKPQPNYSNVSRRMKVYDNIYESHLNLKSKKKVPQRTRISTFLEIYGNDKTFIAHFSNFDRDH